MASLFFFFLAILKGDTIKLRGHPKALTYRGSQKCWMQQVV